MVADASSFEPDDRRAPGVMDDVQALAALEAALAAERQERRRLEKSLDLRNAALDAASTYFMIIDARQEGQPIVYANRAIARDHGFLEPDRLLGRSVCLLVETYTKSTLRENLRWALSDGHATRVELERIKEDGSAMWVGLSTVPIRNAHGLVTHHVTIGADITARIEADRRKRDLQERLYSEMHERERMAIELRLAQKLESVGRLAAGLAHEINTPIQYVGDSVYFLRSAFEDLAKLFTAYRAALSAHATGPAGEETMSHLRALESASDFEFLAEEVPKAFERTMEGADRVAGIVRAMKEFAHPDANEHSPADLNHALTTTLTVARSEYKYAARVVTHLNELPAVLCNIGELNQVFLNLIVNAAHAITDAGKDPSNGTIEIGTRLDDEIAEIVIADNGCGIDKAHLDKIFDPFFTTKEVGRGTGQGLAIARAIVVDKHGGEIDVQSEPGVGTRFILRLPIAGRAAKAAA